MEASEALGTEGGQAAEGAQTGGEQQAPAVPDAIVERFGELDRTMGERFEQLQEAIDQRLPAEGAGESGYGQASDGELFLDEQTGEIVDAQGRTVDPSQLAQEGHAGIDPQALGQLQEQMQTQMQQQLAPIMEHFQDQQAADLEDRYPQLRDEKYAEQVVSAAEEKAEQYGVPELGRTPGFIELVHLAEVGAQRAAEQQTADGASETGVALETDGVSSPGQSEGDLGDRIVKRAAPRTNFFNS